MKFDTSRSIKIEEDIEKMKSEELARLKRSGKVWTRGDPIDSLDPNLRVFIEKHHNPAVKYPLICVKCSK